MNVIWIDHHLYWFSSRVFNVSFKCKLRTDRLFFKNLSFNQSSSEFWINVCIYYSVLYLFTYIWTCLHSVQKHLKQSCNWTMLISNRAAVAPVAYNVEYLYPARTELVRTYNDTSYRQVLIKIVSILKCSTYTYLCR
jgi:hypothetical protein